jgi:hypothetical protein
MPAGRPAALQGLAASRPASSLNDSGTGFTSTALYEYRRCTIFQSGATVASCQYSRPQLEASPLTVCRDHASSSVEDINETLG